MNIQKARLVLNIGERASINAIQQSYRELLVQRHPDKGGTHEAFLLLQEAYAFVCAYEPPAAAPISLSESSSYDSDSDEWFINDDDEEEAIVVESESESASFSSDSESSDSEEEQRRTQRMAQRLERMRSRIEALERENKRMRRQ